MLASSVAFEANSLLKDQKDFEKNQMRNLFHQGISNMNNKLLDPNSFESLSMKEGIYSYCNLSKNVSKIYSVSYSPCGKYLAAGS